MKQLRILAEMAGLNPPYETLFLMDYLGSYVLILAGLVVCCRQAKKTPLSGRWRGFLLDWLA
jgi:hypothetical protein